jgi:hypothetical protein
MTTIYNYKEKYQPHDSDNKKALIDSKHISLYKVEELWTADKTGQPVGQGNEKTWVQKNPNPTGTNTSVKKLCLVFFNKEAMKFFAIEQDSGDVTVGNLKLLDITSYNGADDSKKISLDSKTFFSNTTDLTKAIFKGDTKDKIIENVRKLKKVYDAGKGGNGVALDGTFKNELDAYLNSVFKLTADIQTPRENYKEMDNLFKEVSSGVTVPKSEEKREPVRLPTANISSSPSSGPTRWSNMSGGAVSSEIASILHLLEYNNTVNNNFVNNVLPTLKGGATLNDIDWELEHFITNSKNNEKLFNTITKLASNAQSEALKVYLRRLRSCIAKAQGISHILKNNPDLLTADNVNESSKILKKIKAKIGKYTTDLKKKEEAAVGSFTITIN